MAPLAVSGWTVMDYTRRFIADRGVQAVVVPDTSILMKNPEIGSWVTGRRTLVAIPNMVMAELDTLSKSPTKPAEAEKARAALRGLASLAASGTPTGHNFQRGINVRDDLSIIVIPIDRQHFPPSLQVTNNDHQIASVALAIRQWTGTVPVILLTDDSAQTAAASAAGIDVFRHPSPFSVNVRQELEIVFDTCVAPPSLEEPLEGYLPLRESIVPSFIGREEELAALAHWLQDEHKAKWALVGDGGKGKTSIAFEFADGIRHRDPTRRLHAVVWMSAKRRRFRAGTVEDLSPDFSTLDEALEFLFEVFNEPCPAGTDEKKAKMLSLLTERPTLLVVDDVDSISLENGEVRAFFTDDILQTHSKILLTSRRSLFGMETRQTEVRGLSAEDGRRFVLAKAVEFGQDPSRYTASIDKILEVTEGSPLYIEDLVRLVPIPGIQDAVRQWQRHRGEAARRFALEKEIEDLTKREPLSRMVLIACATYGAQASARDLAVVLNESTEEVEDALRELRQFYLVSTHGSVEDVVLFDLNPNSRSLILKMWGQTDEARGVRGALTSMGKHEQGRGESAKISAISRQARFLVRDGRFGDAEKLLIDLDASYPNRGLVLQQLGWLYKKWEPPRFSDARMAFERAADLGLRRGDLYWHWSHLEEMQGRLRESVEMAERGIALLGPLVSLCHRAARARVNLARQHIRELQHESAEEDWDGVVAVAEKALDVEPQFFERRETKVELLKLGSDAAVRLLGRPSERAPFEERKRALRSLLGRLERLVPDDADIPRLRESSEEASWIPPRPGR